MTTADEALRQAQEQADRDAALEDQEALDAATEQGERIGELERKIEQLQRSNVDGVFIERMYLSDGQGGVRGVVGGSSGVVVRDSAQPVPTAPILEEQSQVGVVEVRWDGQSAEYDPSYIQTRYFWDEEPHNSPSIRQRDGEAPRWNFHPRPQEADSFEWFFGSGSYDVNFMEGMLDGPREDIRNYLRVYVNDPSPGLGGFTISDTSKAPAVTPSTDSWTAYSFFARYAGEQASLEYSGRLNFYDDSGTYVGYTDFEPVILTQGGWVHLKLTGQVPEGTGRIGLFVVHTSGDPAESGSILEFAAQHIGLGNTPEEALEQVETYFDGDTPDDVKYRDIPQGAAFGRVQTRHRLIEGGAQPDPDGPGWREGGAIGTYSGGTTTVTLAEPGQHAIWFYMIGPNNVQRSAFSQPIFVEVKPLIDRDEIQQWIDEKAEELEETIHDQGNREGTEIPQGIDAPEGVIYYQKNAEGQVVGIWQSQGNGDWDGLPLNSAVLASVTTDKLVAGESLIDGVLIRDGSITLKQLTVDGELVAEIAKIITIEADNIAANAIDGMTITGAELIGGRIATSQTGFRIEMQNDRLTAYDSSNVIQARYSGSGIELRPPGGSLTQIGPHIFGSTYATWPSPRGFSAGGSSWTQWYSGSADTGTTMFMPSMKVMINVSLRYRVGLFTGSNANRSFQFRIQFRVGSTYHTVVTRTIWAMNQTPNTDYNFSWTWVGNVPSAARGQTVRIYAPVRYRAIQAFEIYDMSATLTPA